MSTQSAAWPNALVRAGGLTTVARDRLLSVRPVYVLGTLVGISWAALLALALTVRHNGWLYYMGGDQLWHYTAGYLLGHGRIAPTLVGVGWPTILAPISWFAGQNLVSALPAIVLLNGLVLGPLALVSMYGIGSRIGGRLFGYWVALLWIVIPYAGIPYALHGYHQKWTELTLPQILGLGAMSDYPSVVALLVGAYLCLRALDSGHWLWAGGAGFAVGYALAIKPSNAAFLIAPVLILVLYRWRSLVPFVAGLVPPLFVLGFWKLRGYGHLPAFAAPAPERRVALGPGGIFHPLTKYTHANSWVQLHNNLLQLRENLWSDRLLEFVAIAGIAALLIRSRRAGVFVGTWFAAYLVLKGTYVNSRVEDATFWRLLFPAFPAYVLLIAAIPLLVPGIRLRPERPRPLRASRRSLLGGLTVIALVLVVFPVTMVAAARPVRSEDLSAVRYNATLVPVSSSLDLRVTRQGGGLQLTWRRMEPPEATVFYRVFRSPAKLGRDCVVRTGAEDICTAQLGDLFCRKHVRAPDECLLPWAASVGTTRTPTWVDHPSRGLWTYRVGVSANWVNDPQAGDAYVFSRSVTVRR